MKYYIYRNQTVEALFGEKDVAYSGYEDVSTVPHDAEVYLWFYQVPPGVSSEVAPQVATYIEKLKMVLQQVSPEKQFVIFTLVPIANTTIVSGDYSLQLAIDDFNREAASLALTAKNVKLVDLAQFTRGYKQEELTNWKFYFISQAVLNPKLAKDFKAWWTRKQEELALTRKKCLVLDLDNTLWGGILGEDGMTGIKIGGDYPGKVFTYWQQALLELKKTGVMLAVCSKNNEADVLEAWEQNPFMVLHKEDFVAWRINWQDKASNIRELAAELNIGLDSMVFVDDNPTERALIKQMLPMVEVPEFPEKPYLIMDFYRHLVNDYFSIYSVTSEDLKKTEQYKTNALRAAEQARFTDFDDYLRSLEIKLDIMPLDPFNLPRVAQMTQKTNQFNLTTHRYTENDIQQMAKDGCMVYCVSVGDRFGDNGITGEIILRPTGEASMEIDTLLLSCRILGKGIEFAFLDTMLNLAADRGAKMLRATYLKTAKNGQVADFYERAGFTLVENTDDKKVYSTNLTTARKIKDYYSITTKQ